MMNLVHRFGIQILLAAVAIAVAVPAHAEKPPLSVEDLDLTAERVIFDSVRSQASIQAGKNLGALAAANSVFDKNAVSFGFAARSEEAKFFILGTLFSESVAHIPGDQREAAAERIEAMEKELILIDAPGSLYNYLTKLRSMVQNEQRSASVLLDVFSLFQPFFEDFARGRNEDALLLFQAGSWLVDMGLAAASGDDTLLMHTAKLQHLQQELTRMEAPKGVLDALQKIVDISGQEEIAERDLTEVLRLVKKMQNLLG